MKLRQLVGILMSGWLGLLIAAPRLAAQDPGIFADFTTTMGSFTCRLDYATAPKAVANFMGLATGERHWLEESTGRIRTNAFYNGLTFHRVIEGFMCQGGSPNGRGTDGPGYAFPDEFNPAVRHDGPGVLSSANSGTNSNGAQFFITVTSTPGLDNVHTIFGRVASGQSVVDAINQVTTDTNDKPVVPVIIQNVAIRRVGAEAQAFDIHGQGLPVINQEPLRIDRDPAGIRLTVTNRPFAQHYLLQSPDFDSWSGTDLGLELTPAPTSSLIRSINSDAQFFTLTRVQYATSTLAPPRLQNRTLTLKFDGGGDVTVAIMFDANQGGTYTYSPGAGGTVTSYVWSQEPYRGFLWPIYYSGLVPMTLKLDFIDESGGRFSGTAYVTPPATIKGGFTLSP